MSTCFKQFGPGVNAGFCYSRAENPTRYVLEECLAALDGCRYALTFASGVGTQAAVISMLKSGDGIITNDDNYVGTGGLFRSFAVNMGMEMQYVDMSDLKNIENAIKPNVKMVWMESPTNPTIKVFDIKAVSKLVHAKSEAFVVVDNTLLSPYFQQPLALGADIVMHSLTKYINGHCDVIMGSIATDNEEYFNRLKFIQTAAGSVPSPFDCYLVNRGLKTLSLRMEQHFRNSYAVAVFLESHPQVVQVFHPALPSHPQHKIALSQSSGHSGIMSFILKNATLERCKKFLSSLKLFILTGSLGGFESLIQIPSIMMVHPSVTKEDRMKFGIDVGLVRISVGLEDSQDHIDDLDQALNAVGDLEWEVV